MKSHMLLPDNFNNAYENHRAVTEVFKWSLAIFLGLINIETLTLWIRFGAGLLAIPAGVLLIIRLFWEARVKRREHELKKKELERKDQDMWRAIEEQNGTNE